MDPATDTVGINLEHIRGRMAAACRRAGREPSAVRLLAVSKTYGPDAVCAAAQSGQVAFGENRVQEAAAKIPECPGHLQWHLIGHLQSNKAALAARLFDWVHSIDSIQRLEALDRHAGDAGRRLEVLVQVNVSGEPSKFGLPPDQVPELLSRSAGLWQVRVRGLMTIPPAAADPEAARPFFRTLRDLRDRWAAETGLELPELSMGMTHDLEPAIEEGATIVRVGTGIFGERHKPDPGASES